MNIISEFMEEDHDRLDSLFADFQKLRRQDPTKAQELFLEFSEGLRRHITWEDDDLFPLFEGQTKLLGGPTAIMRLEHLRIKDYLTKIECYMGDDTAEWETGLAATLHPHNMKEEQVLYPWIDEAVPEPDRQKVLDKMRMEAGRSQAPNLSRT